MRELKRFTAIADCIEFQFFRSSPGGCPNRLTEVSCVRPSVRSYVHEKLFRFRCNL